MHLKNLDYRLDDRTYRLAYWRAGDTNAPRLLVCVHGLLRHSRDFDELVSRFSETHLILIPDLPGRGLSEWLADPKDYQLETYTLSLATLLQKFPDRPIDWIGTSLGGLIGMAFAINGRTPISRLVLNDIGAELPVSALQRIADYIDAPEFEGLAEVESYLRIRYLSYVGLNDAQWHRLARYGSRVTQAGRFRLHYDPAIAVNARALASETIALWPLWSQIKQSVLLLHGLESDLLTPDIVERMRSAQPQMSLIEFPGIGHAPSLMTPDQIDPVVNWLLEDRCR